MGGDNILNLQNVKFFYKGIDYKTLEIPNGTRLAPLLKLNLVDVRKIKQGCEIDKNNSIITDNFIILYTKWPGTFGGFHVFGIYEKKTMIKLGQFKIYQKSDDKHKNVIELRGKFCHYYAAPRYTQELLEVIGLKNQYALKCLHVDYCVDILDMSVKEICEKINFAKYKKAQMFLADGIVTGATIQVGENILRIYDKIKDIVENHNGDPHYEEYLQQKRKITRIEFAYKTTAHWNNRMFGTILDKIEGYFNDTLTRFCFLLQGQWASVKKNRNIIKKYFVEDKVIKKIKTEAQIVADKFGRACAAIDRNLKLMYWLSGCTSGKELVERGYLTPEIDEKVNGLEQWLITYKKKKAIELGIKYNLDSIYI